MNNNEIILVAFMLATIVMGIWFMLKNTFTRIMFNKATKRIDRVRELVKSEQIPFNLINLNVQPDRVKIVENQNGLMVDNRIYTDKDAYFLEENERTYIIGKKEDFVIALVGDIRG